MIMQIPSGYASSDKRKVHEIYFEGVISGCLNRASAGEISREAKNARVKTSQKVTVGGGGDVKVFLTSHSFVLLNFCSSERQRRQSPAKDRPLRLARLGLAHPQTNSYQLFVISLLLIRCK